MAEFSRSQVICIDIPIGLVAAGYRDCDKKDCSLAAQPKCSRHLSTISLAMGSAATLLPAVLPGGIEAEIIERAEYVELDEVGAMRMARPEELLVARLTV